MRFKGTLALLLVTAAAPVLAQPPQAPPNPAPQGPAVNDFKPSAANQRTQPARRCVLFSTVGT